MIGFSRQDERINNASLGKKGKFVKLEEKAWLDVNREEGMSEYRRLYQKKV